MPLWVRTASANLMFRSWNNYVLYKRLYSTCWCLKSCISATHVTLCSPSRPAGSMCCGDLWWSRPPWPRPPRGRWVISSLGVRSTDNGVTQRGERWQLKGWFTFITANITLAAKRSLSFFSFEIIFGSFPTMRRQWRLETGERDRQATKVPGWRSLQNSKCSFFVKMHAKVQTKQGFTSRSQSNQVGFFQFFKY